MEVGLDIRHERRRGSRSVALDSRAETEIHPLQLFGRLVPRIWMARHDAGIRLSTTDKKNGNVFQGHRLRFFFLRSIWPLSKSGGISMCQRISPDCACGDVKPMFQVAAISVAIPSVEFVI
jgi:hypothetical protein